MSDRGPALLLVHGAWHGGWSWAALQHELDLIGIPSYALDLPGRGTSSTPPDGLRGDVDAITRAIDLLNRPVVLVAHSYGGAPAGNAAARRATSVRALVHVAAFALIAGESVNGFLRSAPRRRVLLGELMSSLPDGSLMLDTARAGELYGDLPASQVGAYAARLDAQPAGTFTEPTDADPFGVVSTAYVVCEDDDAVHVEHQRIMAQRCDRAHVLGGGHFPMLHRPAALAALLAAELQLTSA